MKAALTQCGDRPLVERHGDRVEIVFSDGNSTATISINHLAAYGLADDIHAELQTTLHPIFAEIIKTFGPK